MAPRSHPSTPNMRGCRNDTPMSARDVSSSKLTRFTDRIRDSVHKSTRSNPFVTVVVGDGQREEIKRFQIHVDLVCRQSALFQLELCPGRKETNDVVVKLPAVSAIQFSVYKCFLYTSEVPDRIEPGPAHSMCPAEYLGLLLECFWLGQYLGDHDLKDAVVDRIVLRWEEFSSKPGAPPDIANTIFENTASDSPARSLCVDLALLWSDAQHQHRNNTTFENMEFMHALLLAIKQKRQSSLPTNMSRFANVDTCQYHEHVQAGKPCYKSRRNTRKLLTPIRAPIRTPSKSSSSGSCQESDGLMCAICLFSGAEICIHHEHDQPHTPNSAPNDKVSSSQRFDPSKKKSFSQLVLPKRLRRSSSAEQLPMFEALRLTEHQTEEGDTTQAHEHAVDRITALPRFRHVPELPPTPTRIGRVRSKRTRNYTTPPQYQTAFGNKFSEVDEAACFVAPPRNRSVTTATLAYDCGLEEPRYETALDMEDMEDEEPVPIVTHPRLRSVTSTGAYEYEMASANERARAAVLRRSRSMTTRTHRQHHYDHDTAHPQPASFPDFEESEGLGIATRVYDPLLETFAPLPGVVMADSPSPPTSLRSASSITTQSELIHGIVGLLEPQSLGFFSPREEPAPAPLRIRKLRRESRSVTG